MPEGLEVFILAKALQDLGYICQSFGKHIILKHPYTGEWYDYSFGLAGRLKIEDKSLEIKKIKHPRIVSGDVQKISNPKEVQENLGLDWICASRDDLEVVVRSWLSRKKQIGALLLDQKEICGIGATWASEIFYIAKINPGLKTNLLQFLDLINNLLDAIINVRDRMLKVYFECITGDRKKFVNEWFHNLYEKRKKYLLVYGKGEIIKISGREFHVGIKSDSLENTKQSPT